MLKQRRKNESLGCESCLCLCNHEGLTQSTHKTHIKYDLINGLLDCDIAIISYDVRIGNVC